MRLVLCGSRGQEPWAEVAGRQAEAPNEEGFSPRLAAQKRAASSPVPRAFGSKGVFLTLLNQGQKGFEP